MEVNKEINDIAYAMFKTDYKYVALDGCKVAVLETYISKSISEAAQNASLKEELQRVYELVKKWHNQSDANEQCWKETVKDYNDLRERYKQLHEENERLKAEVQKLEGMWQACERLRRHEQAEHLDNEDELRKELNIKTEALRGVQRLKQLIGYSDPVLAQHQGEGEAIEKMLQEVDKALSPSN
jgi:chromosome segregation ATPase